MTFTITITEEFSAWAKEFPELINRQLSYAARLTVNDLAFAVKEELDQEHLAFYKPTPFTTKAIRVYKDTGALREIVSNASINQGQPTRVGRTEFSAYVGLIQQGMPERFSGVAKRVPGVNAVHSKAWEKVFQHHYGGGTTREMKPFEYRLQEIGRMPKGHYAIETEYCPKDAYDNPQRGFMVQMLSYFEAFPKDKPGYKGNMDEKGRRRFEKRFAKKQNINQTKFFTITEYGKGLPPGIWQRKVGADGKGITFPIFWYVPAAPYNPRIDVVDIGRQVLASFAPTYFGKNLDKAIQGDRSIQHLFKK
jgi:hypothetical protein